MGVPAAVAALPLLAGTVAGFVAADHGGGGVASLAAAAALLALLSAVGAGAVGAHREATVAIAAGCALAGASLGVTSSNRTFHPSLLRWFESRPAGESAPLTIEGVLREDVSTAGASPSLILDVRRVNGVDPVPRAPWRAPEYRGGVRLTVAGGLEPDLADRWRAGRWVRTTAALRLPATYLDPGVRDERRALARRGIVLVGTVKSPMLVEVLGRGTAVQETAAEVRAWVRIRLAACIGRWSARSAAIATAVLIGDRTGLPDADTRRLQDAGTYHVIAISGGNIAILTVLVLGVLGLSGVPTRTAAVTTIVLLLAYREVVVSAPSVERAISAALLYLVARVLDHRGPALNVLAVAATFGIAAAPVALVDPGFLLSFGATLGILAVAVARSSEHPLRTRSAPSRALGALSALLWTTVAAEAALLPIAAVLFGRVTFAGLILNFVAIPLMSVLQAASLAALAVSSVSLAAGVTCGYVAHLAAEGIVESARLTEIAPGLAQDVVTPAWWILAAYYAAGLVVVSRSTLRARRAAGLSMAALAAVIVASPAWAADVTPPPDGTLRVVFLDVGQGDATLVQLPGGGAILVDAGGTAATPPPALPEPDTGTFDVGLRVVAPAIRALGVRRLDALTITHGDPDHVGGVPAILRAFHPPVIWDGVPVPPHPWLRALGAMADTLGLQWRTVQAGDVVRIGQVRIRVLHPPLPEWERQRVRNEDSVVLDIRIGDVSIVLPGDIGAEGERAILPLLEPSRIVVLKAPHHGSATSSTPALLSALRPAVVIFSAGRNNRFGHPHPAVVTRYREMDVAMFSTAEDGAIVLDTRGAAVRVRSWRGSRAPFEASIAMPRYAGRPAANP